MLNNMNFYNFMHKQILVLIGLFVGTGLGYVYIGYVYASFYQEIIWYIFNILISIWGYRLYLQYKNNDLNLEQKEKWLTQLKYFLFSYFSLWTVMFIMYTQRADIELHYIAIATQFGSGVVSATILVSQRKLATITLISIMTPLFIYFILVNEFYSYLLAIFTFVVSGVLHYASSNTYSYLIKSRFQAYNDYLTKLGNRRYFMELLEDRLKVQKENKKFVYLLLIDLDHFKIINDSLGHDIGDELLIEVSNRMLSLSNKHKCEVSRLGGDEFCILSSFYDSKEHCREKSIEFSNLLLETIKNPYNIKDNQLFISASVGVSIIDAPLLNMGTFIKEADIAMYEAKNKGRDNLIIFSDDLTKNIQEKLEIERLLHFAVSNNEINILFQPQIHLQSNEVSCEVLARWDNKTLNRVDTDLFITIAERTGNIIEIGSYILEESFKVLKEWSNDNVPIKQISINISVKQLIHKDFIVFVDTLIKKYLNENLCKKVIFEITETSTADDIATISNNIKTLKEYGIRFSMDDFGTGYSSLNYLKELSIDEMKIDKSFVEVIHEGDNSKNMIKTMLSIASNFDIEVVAEGVETQEQKDFLQEEKCDILQGYYYSKALSKKEFIEYLNNFISTKD